MYPQAPTPQLFPLPELSVWCSLAARPFVRGTVEADAFLRGQGSWLEIPTAATGSPGLQLKGSWLQTSSLKWKCAGLRSKGPYEVSRQTLEWYWSKEERNRTEGRGVTSGHPEHSGPGRGLGAEPLTTAWERMFLSVAASAAMFPKMISLLFLNQQPTATKTTRHNKNEWLMATYHLEGTRLSAGWGQNSWWVPDPNSPTTEQWIKGSHSATPSPAPALTQWVYETWFAPYYLRLRTHSTAGWIAKSNTFPSTSRRLSGHWKFE